MDIVVPKERNLRIGTPVVLDDIGRTFFSFSALISFLSFGSGFGAFPAFVSSLFEALPARLCLSDFPLFLEEILLTGV
jgi:hypothetical protein